MKVLLKLAAQPGDGTPQRSAHYSAVACALGALALVACVAVAPARGEPAFERDVEARVHVLLNAARARHGLDPLERNARLDAAAEAFGAHMARAQRLDHDADGRTPAARVKQRGYAYCVLAENIAFEFDTRGFSSDRLARAFVDGWLDSPTHRANILSRRVTQTGLGVSRNNQGEYYAAQLFALPAPGGGRKCPRR